MGQTESRAGTRGLLGISVDIVTAGYAFAIAQRTAPRCPAMVGKNRQEHSTFQCAGMNRTKRERFHRTHKLVNAMLVPEEAGAGLTPRVGPRPVRHPSDNGSMPPERRSGKGSVTLAELRQTIGRSEKNEPPAAKQSLRLEAALVQCVCQGGEAAGARQDDHLLAHFQAFKHKTEILRRSFLPSDDELTRCGQRRHSSDRPHSNPHVVIMNEVADQCQRYRFCSGAQ